MVAVHVGFTEKSAVGWLISARGHLYSYWHRSRAHRAPPTQTMTNHRSRTMTATNFQFFEGTASEHRGPEVTVRRSGQMVLTQVGATQIVLICYQRLTTGAAFNRS